VAPAHHLLLDLGRLFAFFAAYVRLALRSQAARLREECRQCALHALMALASSARA